MMLAYVAAGGAIGAVLRYVSVSLAGRVLGVAFPYGTLGVNILGSFLMGIIAGWLARTLPHSMELRAFFIVGILGGFTTFSAFSMDAITLWEDSKLMAAAVYVLASVLGALIALMAGLWLVRQWG